jgi:hypothetical protein
MVCSFLLRHCRACPGNLEKASKAVLSDRDHRDSPLRGGPVMTGYK